MNFEIRRMSTKKKKEKEKKLSNIFGFEKVKLIDIE